MVHFPLLFRGSFVMTAWLPSYFSDSLQLSLTQASQAALFPPIAAIAASAIASPVADSLVAKGVSVGLVRKSAQVRFHSCQAEDLLHCLSEVPMSSYHRLEVSHETR